MKPFDGARRPICPKANVLRDNRPGSVFLTLTWIVFLDGGLIVPNPYALFA
jgi:hypothetical protein